MSGGPSGRPSLSDLDPGPLVVGVGFGAFLLGLAVGSGTLLLAGVLVVIGGMVALAAQSRDLV